MSQRSAGPELLRLIELIAKLPGLGPRSARRVALHLLKRNEQLLKPLADDLLHQTVFARVIGHDDDAPAYRETIHGNGEHCL